MRVGEDEVNEVWLTLQLPAHLPAQNDLHAQIPAHLPAQNNLHAQIPAHLLNQLDAQQVEILHLIIQNPYMSMKEIGDKFNKLESWVRSQRRKMSSIVSFKRVGADKNGKWVIEIKDAKN